MDTFTLHEITALTDPLLLPWLDLYEEAFPPEERGGVSWHIRALQARAGGRPTRSRLWALLDGAGALCGMAQTSFNTDLRLAYLGYFAVLPERRGQGVGGAFYNRLLPPVRADQPDFLLFDVERPDRLPAPLRRDLAERRIAFYQRQGARLLTGYTLTWRGNCQRMMFHPFTPVTEAEVLPRAQTLALAFGGQLEADEVTQT